MRHPEPASQPPGDEAYARTIAATNHDRNPGLRFQKAGWRRVTETTPQYLFPRHGSALHSNGAKTPFFFVPVTGEDKKREVGYM